MPVLAAFISSLFTSLASFFAQWFTKTVALRLAAVAVMLAATATFVGAINGIMSSLSRVMPDTLRIAASWFLPDNVSLCLGAYVSARLIKWAYDYHMDIIRFKSSF